MAVTFVCPKGDQSDDAEYCSVCGIKMQVAPGAADPSVERCPSCGVQRQPGARYCETCRYDFKIQSNGPGAAGSGLVDSAPPSTAVVAATSGPSSPTTPVQEALDTDVSFGASAVAGVPSVPPDRAARYWE